MEGRWEPPSHHPSSPPTASPGVPALQLTRGQEREEVEGKLTSPAFQGPCENLVR